MQFEISAQCMFIHTTCCSWSALCAVTLPVTTAACWIHVVTVTSDQLNWTTWFLQNFLFLLLLWICQAVGSWQADQRPIQSLKNLQLFEKVLYLALLKSTHVLIVLLSTKASHRIQKQVAPTWKPPYNFHSFVQSMWCKIQIQRFPITNTLGNTYSLGKTRFALPSSVLRWNIY